MSERPNFEGMTDDEINRWAAERDTESPRQEYYLSRDNGESGSYFADTYAEVLLYQKELTSRIPNNIYKDATIHETRRTFPYAASADALLGLMERWGVHWCRNDMIGRGKFAVRCAARADLLLVRDFYESETCKFPRAGLNAACAAKWAMEQRERS